MRRAMALLPSVQIFKRTEAPARSRRLKLLAPSVLAKRLDGKGGQSSKKIAEELTGEFSLRPAERREQENIIRAMRAANLHFATKIRRMFPLTRTSADVGQFLEALEKECVAAEGHESDDFVCE